jgi:hypothetical protein
VPLLGTAIGVLSTVMLVEVVLLFPVLPSEVGDDGLSDAGELEDVFDVSLVEAELFELVESVGVVLADV